MPNILTITAEDPDDLLNTGAYGAGAVIRVQSAVASTGPFADISGAGSTPTLPLVAGTRSYTAFDPNGTSSTWYQTRFENAGATRLSDWAAAFQAGDETAGLICSLYDVQQELGGGTFSASDNERILDHVRGVTVAIETYCSRWFTPRPLSGSMTIALSPGHDPLTAVLDGGSSQAWDGRFTGAWGGRTVLFPYGVRSISSYQYAVTDQPTSGATYSTIASTSYVLVPGQFGWPSTRVVLVQTAGGILRNGLNTIQWTGTFGWSAVPYDIQGVGVRATVRRYIGKGAGGAIVATGPNGTEFLLPDMSGADRRILDGYRAVPV